MRSGISRLVSLLTDWWGGASLPSFPLGEKVMEDISDVNKILGFGPRERDPNGGFWIMGIGTRVQADPACDCWMMGDRFGTITKITSRSIHVKMDRSGKIRKFPSGLLIKA